jgi:hypothetical protein
MGTSSLMDGCIEAFKFPSITAETLCIANKRAISATVVEFEKKFGITIARKCYKNSLSMLILESLP